MRNLLGITISITMLTIMLSGCAVWPYKSDFDCKSPEGLKCQSLYNVAALADAGKFGPRGTITAEEIDLINGTPSKRKKKRIQQVSTTAKDTTTISTRSNTQQFPTQLTTQPQIITKVIRIEERCNVCK